MEQKEEGEEEEGGGEGVCPHREGAHVCPRAKLSNCACQLLPWRQEWRADCSSELRKTVEERNRGEWPEVSWGRGEGTVCTVVTSIYLVVLWSQLTVQKYHREKNFLKLKRCYTSNAMPLAATVIRMAISRTRKFQADEDTCAVDLTCNLIAFCQYESCGK